MLLNNNNADKSAKSLNKTSFISGPRTIIHNSTESGESRDGYLKLPKVNLIHPIIPSHKAMHKDRYLLYTNPDAPSSLFGASVENGEAVVTQDEMSVFYPQSTALITRAKAAIHDDYYQRKYGRSSSGGKASRLRYHRRSGSSSKETSGVGRRSCKGSKGRLSTAKALTGGDAAVVAAAAAGIQTHDRPWLIQSDPRELATEAVNGGKGGIGGSGSRYWENQRKLANNNNLIITNEDRRRSEHDINKAKSYRFQASVMLERQQRSLNAHRSQRNPFFSLTGGTDGKYRCNFCRSTNCRNCGVYDFTAPTISDSDGVVPIYTHKVPLTVPNEASLASLSQQGLREFINEKMAISSDYYHQPQSFNENWGSNGDSRIKRDQLIKDKMTGKGKASRVPVWRLRDSRLSDDKAADVTTVEEGGVVEDDGNNQYDEEEKGKGVDREEIEDLAEIATYDYHQSYKEILNRGGGIRDIMERQVEDQVEPVWFKNSIKKRIFGSRN